MDRGAPLSNTAASFSVVSTSIQRNNSKGGLWKRATADRLRVKRFLARTNISGARLFLPTDHPPDQRILLHCEQSYTLEWPMRIWFCCLQPALSGGRTPIASTREITQLLDPRISR